MIQEFWDDVWCYIFGEEIAFHRNLKDLHFCLLLDATLFFSFHYDLRVFLNKKIIAKFSLLVPVRELPSPPTLLPFERKLSIING